MKKLKSLILLFLVIINFNDLSAQKDNFSHVNSVTNLSVFWEELTAPDFVKAVELSGGICILPIGVIEKHGPHAPLGTDMFGCREVSWEAALKEYAVIFPYYFQSQIFEAKHQAGTIAYSARMQLDLLQETCDEIARNGFTKILIVNGHGGNGSLLPYFCQIQLDEKKNYAVYLHEGNNFTEEEQAAIDKLTKAEIDGHAGESETSRRMVHNPELHKLDMTDNEDYKSKDGVSNLKDAYTAIWWYANYPNHYAGPAKLANVELGRTILDAMVRSLTGTIKSVKEDKNVLELQNQFYKESENPLKTKQNK